MLNELYKKGYLEYSKMIVDNSKYIGLTAEEAFVLIKILDYYQANNQISIEQLQQEVLMTSAKIDKIVAALMERGYYEIFITYDKGIGKECISFKPLFEKLEDILSNRISFDEYDLEKTVKFLSGIMNRVLTANELEIVQGFMIEDHYTFEQISSVAEDIKKNKRVLSMKSLASGLANAQVSVQNKKEAPKSFIDWYNKL